MLRLNAFVPPDRADAVGGALGDVQGVRHVVLGGSTSEGLMCLTAEVDGVAADEAIELLAGFGLDWRNVTVSRAASIRPLDWHHHERSQDSDAHVWAEVVGRADENSQLALAYLIFMIAAGVIAGIGVLTGSSVLIVGAMAISPDLLPISAAAIGLADHRWHLAGRAGRALAIGLIAGAGAACAATAIVRIFGRVPDDLVLADTVLGPSLTELGPGSILVAIAAGVAGMLAFERAAGAVVGVAISVTTIPAAAYVGDAIALGRNTPMWGALLVLCVNVIVIVAASTATLTLQRHRQRRRAAVAARPADRDHSI